MRRVLWAAVAAVMLTACGDKENDDLWGKDYEITDQMSSVEPWEWTYISLSTGKKVEFADDAAARQSTAWDVAILRFKGAEVALRTNSGTSTSVGQGGIVGLGTTLADTERDIQTMAVTGVDENNKPKYDIVKKKISWSGTEVVDFSIADMPPAYQMQPAVYVVSGDGQSTFRVQFVKYDLPLRSTNRTIVMRVEKM